MIEEVQTQVYALLAQDNSGHGVDHIERVLRLALRFAAQEKADREVVALIALLHDVDDYKIFGAENAENLTNAKRIMHGANVPQNLQTQVLAAIENFGFSKALVGIRPGTLEGKIVSDADMCDSLGVSGILRTYAFGAAKGRPFFVREIFPDEHLNLQKYNSHTDSGVCHLFDKVLKLKGLMLTESGKQEAEPRHQIVVDFLRHFFAEENAPEWTAYLDEYLLRQAS